jgi:Fe-Mn family superoxide dismutase
MGHAHPAVIPPSAHQGLPPNSHPANLHPAHQDTEKEFTMVEYAPKTDFRPKDLDSITDDQITLHWALYEGYVTNVNRLNKELKDLLDAGQATGNPHFAELQRRKGWEYNGMVLHELYFAAMKPTSGDPPAALATAIQQSLGSFEKCAEEFNAIGRMRGVGWAVMYQDPASGAISNHWIDMHETGHPAGFTPLLVLDLWEHAFSVDWKTNPAGRGQYIEAYFKNVDWATVANRLR